MTLPLMNFTVDLDTVCLISLATASLTEKTAERISEEKDLTAALVSTAKMEISDTKPQIIKPTVHKTAGLILIQKLHR